jgi:glycerol-3-phosphate O-acyltransferase/dihydroxyacetone phosphate acyltransferase
MKLFFRDVTVIGEENVPKTGPVIVYGNHNNQFVDGTVYILFNCS